MKCDKKTTIWTFQATNVRNLTREHSKKGNLKRETEYLMIAAEKSAIHTNKVKARIDMTKQKRRYRLCGDRDEKIDQIKSECSKSSKVYKTRHDWRGKVIH